MIGQEGRLCGVCASGEKHGFSAHFRSFPLISAHTCSSRSCWVLAGKIPGFPLISVQIGRSICLAHMRSITLRSMLPGGFRVGKGRVSAGQVFLVLPLSRSWAGVTVNSCLWAPLEMPGAHPHPNPPLEGEGNFERPCNSRCLVCPSVGFNVQLRIRSGFVVDSEVCVLELITERVCGTAGTYG